MNIPDIFTLEQASLNEFYANELLQTNEETEKYGLVLTLEDAKQIIKQRRKTLKGYGRIDLNFDVVKKIIKIFSSSTFINDENYVDIIIGLQETFYYLKNETEDQIGDDKLINIMKNLFENSCEGSLELLNSRLEEFSRTFRKNLC
ncbi:DUF6323 family protein [Clostridium guangxiense]|uniref:DUF6323 family protein n=1 Tax=Clostridium guangxiense TaxID=1662055 RepID=UPI001E407184|nr:DUF6323 family protein [Clostridium guangxiense]MCD2346639.1 DUF6323 family protein [Clostridium guangxiense]